MRALILTAIFTLTAVATSYTPPAPYEIIVTTFDGNTYVAGSGDDCTAAWERAAIPSDWREITCEESR